jgi:hypothetical protein
VALDYESNEDDARMECENFVLGKLLEASCSLNLDGSVKVSGGSLAQLTRLLAAIVELEAYLSERTNAKEALFSTSSVDNKLIQYLICIHYLLLLD